MIFQTRTSAIEFVSRLTRGQTNFRHYDSWQSVKKMSSRLL